MPSFNSDDLHIPQKFHPQFSPPLIRKLIGKFGSYDEPVTGKQLEDILSQYFGEFSNQYRTNMLEIERWAGRNRAGGGGNNPYDALIDSEATNDPANHLYTNLTNVVASESLTTDRVFTVGVIVRPNTDIVESGSPTLAGPVAVIALVPAGTPNLANLINSRQIWDFNGHNFGGNVSVYIEGMQLQSLTVSISSPLFAGPVTIANSMVISTSDHGSTAATRRFTYLTQGAVIAYDTGFNATLFDDRVAFWNVHYSWNVAAAATLNSGDTFWDGGSWLALNASVVTISEDFYIRLQNQSFWAGSGGGAASITFDGNANGIFDIEGYDDVFNVIVNTGADNIVLRGTAYNNITVSGNSGNFRRELEVGATGIVDITGPCDARITLQSSATTNKAIFRGGHIQASLFGRLTGAATLADFIGCTDSFVHVVGDGGATSKPYALDAASARVILLFAGLNTGFGVVGTDAGAGNRVMSEAAGS